MNKDKWGKYIMKDQIKESYHGMRMKIRAGDIFTLSSVIDLKNKSVLDIGCESGGILSGLKEQFNCKINGVTLGTETKKQKKFIKTADMHELPYKDKEFDIVLIMHTLEHSIAPYIVLSEINRVLKKGGHVFIVGPEEGDIWTTTNEHYSTMTFRQIFNLLNKTGFSSVHNSRKEYIICEAEVKRDMFCVWKKTTDKIAGYEEKIRMPIPVKGRELFSDKGLKFTAVLVYYIELGDKKPIKTEAEYTKNYNDYLGRTDSLALAV